MSKYQVYPDYKSTNIEILGKIPCNWSTIRLKHMAKVKNGQDYKHVEVIGDNPGYPVIGSGGPFTKAATPMFTGKSVLLGRKGTIDKPLYINGSFWTVDTMFYTEIKKNTSPKFLYYCSLTIPFDFYSTNTAVPSMTQEDLGSNFFAFPSFGEQQQIANFLDHETVKIDTLIEKQQQLIKLLKEKRQAVISHAVTKGLNPDVPMKDSGVEWLGEVPKHWDICFIKLKTSEITDGAHISPELKNGKYYFVSIKDVKDWGIDFENALLTSSSSYQYLVKTGCKPITGDVLFSKDGTIGKTTVVPENIDFVVASSLIIIRPDPSKLSSIFFDYLCQSSIVQEQVNSFVKGAALKRLSIQNLLKVWGVFPPLEEQIQISNDISSRLDKYKKIEDEAITAISLMQERRTALISAAVTGKIDVRNWQPEQPQPSMEATV